MKKAKTKERIIELLKEYPVAVVASKRAGIGTSTMYRWKKEDKEFATAVDKATEEGLLYINGVAESKLISAIKNENLTGIIFWLKNRHAAYGDKLKVTGSIATSKELTPEQEESIKKALMLADVIVEGEENGSKRTSSK